MDIKSILKIQWGSNGFFMLLGSKWDFNFNYHSLEDLLVNVHEACFYRTFVHAMGGTLSLVANQYRSHE